MSYNVLVIPEDFRNDQYILKPIIEEMLDRAGRPSAKVRVCQAPRLGGLQQAMKKDRLVDIVRSYGGMVDLFILCVDRDGDTGRRRRLDSLEDHIQKTTAKRLLAEHAWQEVEIWVLAGMSDLPSGWSWRDIRAEVDLKERYFLPYAKQRGLDRLPDHGRKQLAREAAGNYTRLRSRCPEDIQALEGRI